MSAWTGPTQLWTRSTNFCCIAVAFDMAAEAAFESTTGGPQGGVGV